MVDVACNKVLDQLLHEWHRRLHQWSLSGELSTAALAALALEEEPDALRALIAQWSVSDFKALPAIALLSTDEISGAMGAYASRTSTIYLNQDWLETATQDQVIAVLTEELGHHLDGVLNCTDTEGDEGESFANQFINPANSANGNPRFDNDHGQIRVNGNIEQAEFAAISASSAWIKQYGSSNYEVSQGVAIDPNGMIWTATTGRYLMDGQSKSNDADNYIISFNADGNIAKTINAGPISSQIICGITSTSNAIYVGGQTIASSLDGQTNSWGKTSYVTAYDLNGTKLWTRLLSGYTGARSITSDSTGIYLAGFTYGGLNGSPGLGAADAFLAKYDTSGAVLWARVIGGNGDNANGGINQVSANGSFVAVAGYSNQSIDGQPVNSGTFVSYFTSDGTKLWTRMRADGIGPILVAPDGSVYIAGGKLGTTDVFVSKLDVKGQEIWSQTYGTDGTETANQLAINADGELVLLGSTSGTFPGQTNSGSADHVFLRLDASNGSLISAVQWGSSGTDTGTQFAISKDNTTYLSGSIGSALPGNTFAGGSYDPYLIRINPLKAPTYALTTSATSINEGATLTTTVSTSNVASGTTLYYSLSGTGITASDLSVGNLTGSGTVGSDGKLTLTHTLANDLTTEGTETLLIKVFSDAARTAQVGATASVSIADSSTPIVRGNSLYTVISTPNSGQNPFYATDNASSVAYNWFWNNVDLARRLGGDLATINTKSEQTFLNTRLGNFTGQGLLIGLHDSDSDNKHKWVSGQVVDLDQFDIRFDSIGDHREDYVRIYLDASNAGPWADVGAYSADLPSYGLVETPFIRRGDSAYVVVQGPTWEEAEANAVKLGGHLVTINDANENQWLINNIQWNRIDSNVYAYWIGLTDSKTEGQYKWSSGEDLSWNPDIWNSDSGGEDWFSLVYYDHNNINVVGAWNDLTQTPGDWSMGYWNMKHGIAEIKLAPNNQPIGTPKITGTLKAGSTLTIDASSIKDADNFTEYTPTYQYTWESSTDGSTWSKLTSVDATDNNNTYTLTTAEVGKQVRGVVSYLDGYGTNEVVNTAASRSISNNLTIRGNSLYTIVDGYYWAESEQLSRQIGGNLLTVNSEEENKFVLFSLGASAIDYAKARGQNFSKTNLHIGLNDLDVEGNWAWSSGQKVEYSNWQIGEPGNGTEGNHAGVLVNWWAPGKWHDLYDSYIDGDEANIGIAETPFIRRGDSAYVIVQGPTWEEAEANAVKLGGHLVTINDAAENEWLAKDKFFDRSGKFTCYAIGFTDKYNETQWEWSDGTISNYQSWDLSNGDGATEPNSNGHLYSDYGYIGRGFQYAPLLSGLEEGSWYDDNNNCSVLSWGGEVFGIAEIKLAPNSKPTGAPTLWNPRELSAYPYNGLEAGMTLSIKTSTINDADNFDGWTPTYTYSWQVANDPGLTMMMPAWQTLTSKDATDGDSSFTLTPDLAGKLIRGVVSYMDGYGTIETLYTDPSTPILSGNQAPTSINLSAGAFDENIAAGSVIAELSSIDLNRGDTFSYSLVSGEGSRDNAAFFISDNQLKIKAAPNYESKSSYSIRLRSSDQTGLTVEQSFSLSVNDLYEGPTYRIDAVIDPSDPPSPTTGAGSYGLYRISGINGTAKSVLAISDVDLDLGVSYRADALTLAPITLLNAAGQPLAPTCTPLAIRQDGSNLEVLFRPSPTAATYQTQDFSLTTGRAVGKPTPATRDLISFERAYQEDLNGDGVIGAQLTIDAVIDAANRGFDGAGEGSYGLYRISGINGSTQSVLAIADEGLSEGSKLTDGDLTTLLPLLQSNGKALPSTWNPIAIRIDGDKLELLYQPKSSVASYQTQDFSLKTGKAVGSATAAVTSLVPLEVAYDQDLNNDGVIGSLLSIDSVIDAANRGFDGAGEGSYGLYRISGINGSSQSVLAIADADLNEGSNLTEGDLTTLLPLLQSNGKALPSTWNPIAIRIDGDKLELLYQPKSSVASYQTQDFSLKTGKAVGPATAAINSLATLEVPYDQDLNNDGVIGVSLKSIGQTTGIAGSRANDTLSLTSLDVGYGAAGNDLLSTAATFESYDPITMIGGTGSDIYKVSTGSFCVIYDLGSSNDTEDTITGLTGSKQEWTIQKVDNNDYLLHHTTNDTTVLLVDPLGKDNAGNRIEFIRFERGAVETIASLSSGATSILAPGTLSYASLADQTGKDIAFAYGIDPSAGPLSLKSELLANQNLIV